MWFDLEIYNGLCLALVHLILFVISSTWICICIWLAFHVMTKWLHIPESIPSIAPTFHSSQRKEHRKEEQFLLKFWESIWLGWLKSYAYPEPIPVTRRQNALIGLTQVVCSWGCKWSQIFKDSVNLKWKLGDNGRAKGEIMLGIWHYVQGCYFSLLSF